MEGFFFFVAILYEIKEVPLSSEFAKCGGVVIIIIMIYYFFNRKVA